MLPYLKLRIKKHSLFGIQAERFLKPWLVLFCTFIAIFAVECVQCPHSSYADFTIVVYPDSQNEVDSGSANLPIWQAQNEWVVNNRSAQNIVAVLGMGDIVNAPSIEAYNNATVMGYDLLEYPGIPYLPLLGNHDYNDLQGRTTNIYDEFFGPIRFSGKPWYLEGHPPGSNANIAISFDVGDQKYLVLGLEFFPRESAVTWAQGIINSNPDREVIVVTHAYLTNRGTLYQDGDNYGPIGMGLTQDYSGQELWDNFIKSNSRIFLVISGHDICSPNNAHLISSGSNGNIISQIFTNYQCYPYGGNGYILLLKIKPADRVIEVTPYSTTLETNDPMAATYILPYNPSVPTITSFSLGPTPPFGVTLETMVNDNGALTNVHFEYGQTTDYGTSVAGGIVDAGAGSSELSANIAGLAPGATYHARAVASNIAGTASSNDFSFTAPLLSTTWPLNLAFTGTGRGSISIIPSSFSCSNSCNLELNANITVNLIAVPDGFSAFNRWSGDCNSGLDCTIIMNGTKFVAAEFTALPPVLIGTTVYQDLQTAYNGAFSGATIKALAAEFNGNLFINRDISIFLDGGYSGDYIDNFGITTVKGAITIENGTIAINNLSLQ